MKYKVIKEFGCAKKGDVIEQNGAFWGMKLETENTSREMYLSEHAVEDMVKDGYLLEFENTEDETCDCCPALEKVSEFIDDKLEQYAEDYNNMMEAYNNQDIPACVKVEAETVYYNMTKILNAIKDIINE